VIVMGRLKIKVGPRDNFKVEVIIGNERVSFSMIAPDNIKGIIRSAVLEAITDILVQPTYGEVMLDASNGVDIFFSEKYAWDKVSRFLIKDGPIDESVIKDYSMYVTKCVLRDVIQSVKYSDNLGIFYPDLDKDLPAVIVVGKNGDPIDEEKLTRIGSCWVKDTSEVVVECINKLSLYMANCL